MTSGVEARAQDELVFLPLGGAGEIGMNFNAYGFGPPERRRWLIVDIGIAFGDESAPGVDVVMPDIRYMAERRRDVLGIVLTHAHEDHIGAIAHLWPELRCPVYATPFTAELVKLKLDEAGLLGETRLHVLPLGGSVTLGPFNVELVSLTHSIPEPNAVAIRTPLGVILNTGDWKIDPEPVIGQVTDEAALRKLGEDGVLAMVCDSTNVFVPGRSGSEAGVRDALAPLIAARKGKIAVTAFASNVARIDSICRAAEAAGRSVVLVGRSMHRITGAAKASGYLLDLPAFADAKLASVMADDQVLFLCTGSQGEPGSALERVASGNHPSLDLGPGDTVIFSSRIIPGNEKRIFALQNALSERGVEIITDSDHHVHVSGHPCRDELADMYRWVRPRIAVAVHGEMRHLAEHKRLAEELQVPHAAVVPNGSVLRLAPGRPGIIDEVPSGRLHLDGRIRVLEGESPAHARRSLAFAGFVGVTVVLNGKGKLLAGPSVMAEGVPEQILGDLRAAAEKTVEGLGRLSNDEEVAEAVRRAVRRAAQSAWGKKPVTRVEILRA